MAGDTVAVNKTNINPCPHGDDIPGEEKDSKQIIECLALRKRERMRAGGGHRVLNSAQGRCSKGGDICAEAWAW